MESATAQPLLNAAGPQQQAREALTALIARVEGLAGADREVDAELEVTFVRPGWVTSKKDPGAVAESAQYFWPEGKLRYITKSSRVAPSYTSSIDAALAFAERVLPGHQMNMHRYSRLAGVAEASIGARTRAMPVEAPTLPLAIILATLKAKVAE